MRVVTGSSGAEARCRVLVRAMAKGTGATLTIGNVQITAKRARVRQGVSKGVVVIRRIVG